MRLIKIGYIIIILFFCVKYSNSQDIHFSQFWTSPLNLNPSYTGQFNGDYRFTLNNKNQWLSFANAYRTFAGSFDTYFEDLIDDSVIGAGVQLNNDVAGDGNLSTNQISLASSITKSLNSDNTLNMSFGISSTFTFSTIDYSNFRFGSQYVFDSYDPHADHYETWHYNKTNYFSINSGLSATYYFNEDLFLGFGIAAFNINQPKRTFYDDSEAHLPVRWTYNIFGEYNINDDLWIEPKVLFMHQQKYKEINIGGLFRFDYNPLGLRAIYIGALGRVRDAGIFVIGADYQSITVCLNYDINMSKLSGVSRGRGGAEISLIYKIINPKTFEPPYYRKCPEFM